MSKVAAVPPHFDRRRTSHAPVSRTKATPRRLDAEAVIARLEQAGRTLLCLPRNAPGVARCQTRHGDVADAAAAYAALDRRHPAPGAAEIGRMDRTLAWVTLIPAERPMIRRIVGCRCLVSPATGRHLFSWRRLAGLTGIDHRLIQRWHAEGIDAIVASLGRDATLAWSWDSVRP